MTQLEAIRELAKCDHEILDGEYAHKIAGAFGLEKISTESIQDNRSGFKGAHFPSLKEGEWAHDVIDAAVLACEIAEHLGVAYMPMYGRGSQLRSACGAVERFLEVKQKS